MHGRLFFDRNAWGIWSYTLRAASGVPIAYQSGFPSPATAAECFRDVARVLGGNGLALESLLANAVYNESAI